VERGDAKSVMQLIELILGCAVHCANKEAYITDIMTRLEENVKADLMATIQNIMGLVAAAPAVPPTPGMVMSSTR
jgi:protein HOOK3